MGCGKSIPGSPERLAPFSKTVEESSKPEDQTVDEFQSEEKREKPEIEVRVAPAPKKPRPKKPTVSMQELIAHKIQPESVKKQQKLKFLQGEQIAALEMDFSLDVSEQRIRREMSKLKQQKKIQMLTITFEGNQEVTGDLFMMLLVEIESLKTLRGLTLQLGFTKCNNDFCFSIERLLLRNKGFKLI